MILGGDIEEVERGHTALFESTDPTLHAWELVNPKFWKTRGGGGGLFYPLPGDATPTATHMLQVDDNGGGNPWFEIGLYDAAAATFTADGGPLLPLDLNPDFVFSELHVDGGVMRHWAGRALRLLDPAKSPSTRHRARCSRARRRDGAAARHADRRARRRGAGCGRATARAAR